VDLAGEAMRRQPLGHRFGVEERLVDALGRGLEYAVEPDGAGHGSILAGSWTGLQRYDERRGANSTRRPPASTF
jgi:hypothetical protein